MSVHITSDIWDNASATGTDLLVLLAIGDYANADGVAWPRMQTLAAKCRMSQRQARRHVSALVKAGDLRVEYGAGNGQASLYHVTCGALEAAKRVSPSSAFESPNRDADDRRTKAQTRTSTTRKGVAGVRPYNEEEPSYNHQIEIERGDGDSSLSLSVPFELRAFDDELRSCPGYNPDGRFYQIVLRKYACLDLEEEAMRISGWFVEHANRKRLCNRGFVLRWLSRELNRPGRAVRKRDPSGLTGLEIFSR